MAIVMMCTIVGLKSTTTVEILLWFEEKKKSLVLVNNKNQVKTTSEFAKSFFSVLASGVLWNK
jgi:hypothetical protein